MLPLKEAEQGEGLQSGVEGQPFGEAVPHVGERVVVSLPVAWHPNLAGEPAEPAVLAGRLVLGSRPALAAATAGANPRASKRRSCRTW
jgi:hypothetical protein